MTISECTDIILKNFLEKFPKNEKYINNEWVKIRKTTEKLLKDMDFTFDSLQEQIKNFKNNKELKNFDENISKFLKYNEYLKKRYLDLFHEFSVNLIKKLEKKENLKDYE